MTRIKLTADERAIVRYLRREVRRAATIAAKLNAGTFAENLIDEVCLGYHLANNSPRLRRRGGR